MLWHVGALSTRASVSHKVMCPCLIMLDTARRLYVDLNLQYFFSSELPRKFYREFTGNSTQETLVGFGEKQGGFSPNKGNTEEIREEKANQLGI